MNLDDRINAFMAMSFEYFCGNKKDAGAAGLDLRDVLEAKPGKEQSSSTRDIPTRKN